MRRHLSYANVAATLALVFAMSGGALAAKHYLISSTKQISPKVLRKLHGARGGTGPIGPVGPQGVTGAQGTRGVRGPQGEPGFSALSQLPSGKSESGDFAVSTQAATAQTVSTAVTFSVPLAATISAEKVEFTPAGKAAAHCLGPGTAANGWLCVYIGSEFGVEGTPPTTFNPEAASGGVGTGRFGVGFNWTAHSEGVARVTGTYTVTAP